MMATERTTDHLKLNVELKKGRFSGKNNIHVYQKDQPLNQPYEGVKISFQRTLRVSDNADSNELPPSLGSFPLYKVNDYKEKLPINMTAKGGLFLPMYQREAMYIDFESAGSFLVKVYAGGINIISGRSSLESSNDTLQKSSDAGRVVQDYAVLPQQPWIDGFATADGHVRQFVAMPRNSGYSVEQQLTGSDKIRGLQFEIIPHKIVDGPYGVIHLRTLTGKQMTFKIRNFQIVILRTVLEEIEKREAIPVDQIRLVFAGERLGDDVRTLSSYGIEDGSIIHIVLRLRGGGLVPAEIEELTMSAGGRIKQSIVADKSKREEWDFNRAIFFNVQIINSDSFTFVTGLPPPSTPITARTYLDMGLPYFSIWDEKPSGVSGNFSGLKSVNEIDSTKKTKDALKAVQEVSKTTNNPTIGYTWEELHGKKQKPRFNHISDLKAAFDHFSI